MVMLPFTPYREGIPFAAAWMSATVSCTVPNVSLLWGALLRCLISEGQSMGLLFLDITASVSKVLTGSSFAEDRKSSFQDCRICFAKLRAASVTHLREWEVEEAETVE